MAYRYIATNILIILLFSHTLFTSYLGIKVWNDLLHRILPFPLKEEKTFLLV